MSSVPQIVAPPANGSSAPKDSAKDSRSGEANNSKSGDTQTHTRAETPPDPQAQSKPPQSQSQPRDQSQSQSQSQPRGQSQSQPQDQSQSRPQDQSQPQAQSKSKSESQDPSESQPKDQSQTHAQAQAQAQVQSRDQSQTQDQSQPKAQSPQQAQPRAQAQIQAGQPVTFNPVSEWEEPIEVPLLTLFDMHRKPRQVITDPSARVRMPVKVLSAEFHCPVCLGYMKKTSIVMECLHRFCGECIQKCLRLGKKECPSCRIHIPSRRSLRPDPNFDDLIMKIYGDIDALEKHEEKEIEILNKSKNMNNAYADARKWGIMQQAIHRKKKGSRVAGRSPSASGVKRKAPGPVSETPSSSVVPTIANLEESTQVNFVLRRHPQETLVDRLDREYIRTASDITIQTMKMFLSQKLSYEPASHFQILTVTGGKGVILEDSITVGDILQDIFDRTDSELVLHFRVVPN